MCFYQLISALLLTAQNTPLIDWSKTTLNNVLLQGDKMYLQALDNGFVVLEPGVEFMSHARNVPAVVHAKTTRLQHESFDAHNNDTIIIKPIEAKTIELPIVVEAIGAKTSYKHCIDNIGASISLVYANNWQNILHVLVKL